MHKKKPPELLFLLIMQCEKHAGNVKEDNIEA